MSKGINMTASWTKTRYHRMVLTLLLGICFLEAVFGMTAEEAQLILQVHNEHRAYRNLCGEKGIVPAEEILQPLEPIGNVGKWNSVGRNSVIQSELAGAVAYWMEESNIYKHNTDSCSSTFECNSYKQSKFSEFSSVNAHCFPTSLCLLFYSDSHSDTCIFCSLRQCMVDHSSL
ncbi:venom allergen-like (VAL) 23 protein [Schistosoma mansoni]|uniref:venom allergen-like (VAL) 23 protein n=1 Tax=Schistosoma mansoni TaxID=6183 RepID=UPI00022DC121|nr:venom allergen-like (VAL) 23 protein [Schistosoma mansoni]|eukprot:XP_018653267.1 venom allergen-like (VAL) 23 protein [Schistosoma mansoni]